MRTSKSIFKAIAAIMFIACLVFLAPCAGRKGTAPSGGSESKEPEEARRGETLLPGQNRYLPSEDPRNQPSEGREMSVRTDVRPMYEPPAEVVPDHPFPPPPIPLGETRYRVQVLASTFLDRALRMREELAAGLGEEVFLVAEGGIWKVQIGDEKERSSAQSLRRRLIGLGYEDAFIVESNGR